MSIKRTYLGDSIYLTIDSDQNQIVLTTENGLPTDPSNRIVLGPREYMALLEAVERGPE